MLALIRLPSVLWQHTLSLVLSNLINYSCYIMKSCSLFYFHNIISQYFILNRLAPTVSTGLNKQPICLRRLERRITADSMFFECFCFVFFAWHSVDLHVSPRRREAKRVKHREEREGGWEESRKEVKGWPNPQIWLHHQRRGKQEMHPNLSAALKGLRNPGELWGNNLKPEIKEKMFTEPPGPVYAEQCRPQDRPPLEP